MAKKTYKGLSTRCIMLECAPLLATSNVKLKVKTNTENYEWVKKDDELTPLSSSISNSSFD